MTCLKCGGYVWREPAAVVCKLCGCYGVIVDANHARRVQQRVLDAALRPCSAECDPLYNVPRPLTWFQTMREPRLPVGPTTR